MGKLTAITVAVFLLGSLTAQGQNGKGKRKGGFTAKNLQVLEQANFPSAMQSFVQALGLANQGRCDYCHVEDRAADDKPQKLIARNMILMMREINAGFQDGKPHVTCYTCHRGSIKPAIAP